MQFLLCLVLVLSAGVLAVDYSTVTATSKECGNFACSLCQGNCQHDDKCQKDKVCWQRLALEQAPGNQCNGEGVSGQNYCIMPRLTEDGPRMFCKAKHTKDASGSWIYMPNGFYSRCEGDCDHDDECGTDLATGAKLVCFLRDGYDPVPSCSGSGTANSSGMDYCIPPTQGQPTVRLVGTCVPGQKCNICEGDCNTDRDCADGLMCYERSGWRHTPGCSGVGGLASNNQDFCSKGVFGAGSCVSGSCRLCQTCTEDRNCTGELRCLSPDSPLVSAAHRTKFLNGCLGQAASGVKCCYLAPELTTPTGVASALCEGGCVHDGQCLNELVCWQRKGMETVTGCYGAGEADQRYCVSPNVTRDIVIAKKDPASNLQACQGPCVSDGDCASGLVCFQRSGYEAAPGCFGSGPEGAGMNVCIVPTADRILPCPGGATCGMCQGACSSNNHCAEGLVCLGRSGFEPVQGCSGSGGVWSEGQSICTKAAFSAVAACNSKCGLCQSCASDVDCAGGLSCLNPTWSALQDTFRASFNNGCLGTPASGSSYCYLTPKLANAATSSLEMCDGNCTHDGNCRAGLVCLKPADKVFPGCRGTPEDTVNYCVALGNNVAIETKGNPGSVADMTRCKADCDHDSECAPGLVCYQRDGFQPIPTCYGSGPSNTMNSDACIAPLGPVLTVVPMVDCNSNNRCGLCEGDCDTDNDCIPGLVCGQRTGYVHVEPCSGSGTVDSTSKDFCVPASYQLVAGGCSGNCGLCQGGCATDADCAGGLRCLSNLAFLNCQGAPQAGRKYCFLAPLLHTIPAPLFGLCQGDCAHDGDCDQGNVDTGLVCLQRYGAEQVAGCRGSAVDGANYCVTPNGLTPTLVANPTGPLGQCRGPCAGDQDCQQGLVCIPRSGFTPVHSCFGSGQLNTEGQSMCVSAVQAITIVGRPCAAGACGMCEGACESDANCEWGLVCYLRNDLSPVPGCSGMGEASSSGLGICSQAVFAQKAGGCGVGGCGMCQGGCSSDQDCKGLLRCFDDPAFLDGCMGKQAAGVKYCYLPPLLRMTDTIQHRLCEGECSHDGQCGSGLVCLQRDADEAVPGCRGIASPGVNYCITAPADSSLIVRLSNSFLKGRCEGDCTYDDNCADGLVCYQRDGYAAVSSCIGSGSSNTNGMDPCIVPVGHVLFMGPTKFDHCRDMKSSGGCGVCQGDCDDNSECAEGLVCAQRDTNTAIPGCVGSGVNGTWGMDFCAYPVLTVLSACPGWGCSFCKGACHSDADCEGHLLCSDKPAYLTRACLGKAVPGTKYCYMPEYLSVSAQGPPYKECEGDCKGDSDCAMGLVCMMREAFEPVPGCRGHGTDAINYCFVPKLPLLMNKTHVQQPKGICEGHCDNDEDCAFGLVCFQRKGLLPVPGCHGTGALDTAGVNVCVAKAGVGIVFKANPCPIQGCEQCEGDCDSNLECKPDLVCFKRDAFDPVPGCSGLGDSQTWDMDVCGAPNGYILPHGGEVSLPVSVPGRLLTLTRLANSANELTLVVARSYDGYRWEGLFPDPINLSCNKNERCNVFVGPEDEGRFRVDLYEAEVLGTEPQVARLLLQASFGPSASSIQDFTSKFQTAEQWITAQMALPATSLRDYYRARTHPRLLSTDQSGSPRKPCELGSRWNRFAFTILDKGKGLGVRNSSGTITLEVDGHPRTELDFFPVAIADGTAADPSLVICDVREYDKYIMVALDCASTKYRLNDVFATFEAVDPATTKNLDAAPTGAYVLTELVGLESLILTQAPADCDLENFLFLAYQGQFYRYDPRLELKKNTLESPSNDREQDEMCPAVVKNFLNKDKCVRASACSPLAIQSAEFTLSQPVLRKWYTLSRIYLYYVLGLRLEDIFAESACVAVTSRWLRTAGACVSPTISPAGTVRMMTALLKDTNDANPYVRDIHRIAACSDGELAIGANLTVTYDNGSKECFTHVHPELYDVRDFTYWAEPDAHPGNAVAASKNHRNPIKKHAWDGNVYLTFPSWHGMDRWRDNRDKIPQVGRYGDTLDFRFLETDLQTLEMAQYVGALAERVDDGFELCGSPHEAANVPTLGHRYHWSNEIIKEPLSFADIPYYHDYGKSNLWWNVVLSSSDQLRQKVAWALAQIYTMGSVGFDKEDEIEPWAGYYDIFTRNAFGNVRDIMQEVSWSPMMAIYLSYFQNKAFATEAAYPDENYAREIMQLFSIGLCKLKSDGSAVLDANGDCVDTYSNDDIVAFARIWTGFDRQQPRGNIENRNGAGSPNNMDPMQLKPEWRDVFPKTKLNAGYIGDQFPLCQDLPPQHYLTQGAKYVYTGATSAEGQQLDGNEYQPRFTPSYNPPSALYSALCARASANGPCTFPSEVVLSSNLPCDVNNLQECKAASLRVVKMVDPNNNMIVRYYTYIPPACVNLAMFQGKITKERDQQQCTDPATAIAGIHCCGNSYSTSTHGCLFAVEHADFATAQQRCAAKGMSICDTSAKFAYRPMTWTHTCAERQYSWVGESCEVKLQVFGSGMVALIDPFATSTYMKEFTPHSGNSFRVYWDNNKAPAVDACPVGCTESFGTCMCSVTITTSAVFTDTSSLPSTDVLRASLPIGAPNPLTFGSRYSACDTDATDGAEVTVWAKDCSAWGADTTIFQLPPRLAGGADLYLFNKVSKVTVGGAFSFRNPPTFLPAVGGYNNNYRAWFSDRMLIPQAEAETMALIDHLFEHDNTPVFISMRLIQRLLTSNPSPKYIKRVADAFRTGSYKGFGDGRYGSLAATVAAILLDREARSATLDADPTFGALREPLVKLVHFMRAMDFEIKPDREVMFQNLRDEFAQEAFRAPSVFGFYLPEYQPVGAVADSGLVSPESQIYTTPNVVNYFNGMVSLIDSGLTTCNQGFGNSRIYRNCAKPSTTADGLFQYAPTSQASPEDVVAEMSILLNGGRLNPAGTELIRNEYWKTRDTISGEAAVKRAMKLFLMTAEFHATNAHTLRPVAHKEEKQIASQGRPLQVIVVIFMAGGFDSYNLLVPHSGCRGEPAGTTAYYDEYAQVRQGAAVEFTRLKPISAGPAGHQQPCDTFGVHPSMPFLQQLYKDGDAAFMANIGNLVEPVTKQDFINRDKSKKQFPPSLFAHNVQQRHLQNLDPQTTSAKGVAGRAIQSLLEQPEPFKTDLFSLMGNTKILEGSDLVPNMIDAYSGVVRFSQYAELKSQIEDLNEWRSESMFADTFSHLLKSSFQKTEVLSRDIEATTLNTVFSDTYIGNQFMQAAKLIKLREKLQTEKAVFMLNQGGFDTHNTFDLDSRIKPIDDALSSFVQEMKLQGMWVNVTVLSTSDFGRTLTSNGQGTDHAWAGHHFVASGSLKGSQIFGKYPETLLDSGDEILGRGRVLPTIGWEHMWYPILQWFGVAEAAMPVVLPNYANFPNLIPGWDMYETLSPPAPPVVANLEAEQPKRAASSTVIGVSSAAGLFVMILSISMVWTCIKKRRIVRSGELTADKGYAVPVRRVEGAEAVDASASARPSSVDVSQPVDPHVSSPGSRNISVGDPNVEMEEIPTIPGQGSSGEQDLPEFNQLKVEPRPFEPRGSLITEEEADAHHETA